MKKNFTMVEHKLANRVKGSALDGRSPYTIISGQRTDLPQTDYQVLTHSLNKIRNEEGSVFDPSTFRRQSRQKRGTNDRLTKDVYLLNRRRSKSRQEVYNEKTNPRPKHWKRVFGKLNITRGRSKL